MIELSEALGDVMFKSFTNAEMGPKTGRALLRTFGGAEHIVNNMTAYFAARPGISRKEAVDAIRKALSLEHV